MRSKNNFYMKSIADVLPTRIAKFRLDKDTAGYLEDYLKQDAVADEQENEAKTYVVFDGATDEIVSYFSLKATSMTLYDSEYRKNMPMVEMSNFAVSDAYKEAHPNVKNIGSTIFGAFVVPTIRQAAEIIGVWGICIYALPYEHLMHFYQQRLGFHMLPEELSAQIYNHVKPTYDEDCIFMYQKL